MRYEPIFVEISLFERGWVTLNANFRGKGASPTNDFWHQKSSPWAIVWWKKLPKSSTAWVGCTNVTDNRRQTEFRRQRQVAIVNASSRPLKIDVTVRYSYGIYSLLFHQYMVAKTHSYGCGKGLYHHNSSHRCKSQKVYSKVFKKFKNNARKNFKRIWSCLSTQKRTTAVN